MSRIVLVAVALIAAICTSSALAADLPYGSRQPYTVAQPLKSLTFGKSDNPLEVQQITIDGNGMVQQVELRAGQPMIISGFERREDEYDRRRLTPGAPYILGGSDRASTQRATTIVIVTAQVEEGF